MGWDFIKDNYISGNIYIKYISMNLNLGAKYEAVAHNWEVGEFSLKDLLSFSEKTLLFFYPKDNTPGCTVENKDFSCLVNDFEKLWITLIWVSKDSIDSHKKFIDKQDLKIDLISDPDLSLHKELMAYGEKKNYGKTYMWVIRSTFLLDKEGNILNEWRNVRAKWHAERILKELS